MYNSFGRIIWTIIGFMIIIQQIEQSSVLCSGGGGGDQHSATTAHPPSHPRFLCPKQNGRFACRLNPQSYYLCDNYVPFLQLCPGTLFFDKDLKDCKSAGHFKLETEKPKH